MRGSIAALPTAHWARPTRPWNFCWKVKQEQEKAAGEGTACHVQRGPADSGLLGSGVRVKMNPSGSVPEGEPVTVTCEDPAALSSALYAWFHNGHWLQEGPASSLQFLVTTRAHAGAYFCQVHDTQGTRSSRPASLQILCEQGLLSCGFASRDWLGEAWHCREPRNEQLGKRGISHEGGDQEHCPQTLDAA